MSDEPPERIVALRIASLPDAVLAERMRHHGFLAPDEDVPRDPEAERVEREAIADEMRSLVVAAVADPEAVLREERKRRAALSKQVKAERRAKAEADKVARRAAHDARARETVVYAGLDVSAGLESRDANVARLEENGLPLIPDAAALAHAIGISIAALRFLTFHRRGATIVHYHHFGIPKKAGGIRAISAPKTRLAQAQAWVLANVLEKVAPTERAHGFVRGRSILTNAAPHVGRAVVVNMDLENFFPTLGFRRVKGLFRALGYSEHVAILLALITTEPPRLVATIDGEPQYVSLGDRVLPQGASTSPAITNLICRRLDNRLAAVASRRGFTYTRYADDLTFSSDDASRVGSLLRVVREVVEAEGFREHPKKTHVMRRGRRQEVTGLVVNARMALPREARRALRALLHNAGRTGLAMQNREGHPRFEDVVKGRVAYAAMVDPSAKEELEAALRRALGWL